MNIRIAKNEDIDQINNLYKILFAYMCELQPAYFKATNQDTEFLTSIIKSESADIIVAENNGHIVGFALVQEQVTPPYNCIVQHKYAFLMDIAVEPESRDQGVGSALINSVKQWAKKRNLEYLELNVISENLRAYKLYKNENFTEVMRTMRCSL